MTNLDKLLISIRYSNSQKRREAMPIETTIEKLVMSYFY